MRIPVSILVVAAVMFCAAEAQAAAPERQARPVTPFTAVRLAAPIDVELVQGDREGLEIEGPADLVAAIETRVEDNTLRIDMKPGLRFGNARVKATVTTREIESIAIAGSGDLRSAGIRSGALRVAIQGSGDVRLAKLAATRLEASISGSGDLHVAGRVDRAAVRIEGSGDVHGQDLEAGEVRVSIAGSGDAAVWARDALSVSIAGSGDVRYRGDPKVERTVAGSGSVRRAPG